MRSIAQDRDPARPRAPRLPFLRPVAALLLACSGLAVAVPHAAAAANVVTFLSPTAQLNIAPGGTAGDLKLRVTNGGTGVSTVTVAFNYAPGNTASPTAITGPCSTGFGVTDGQGFLDCGSIASGPTSGTAKFTATEAGTGAVGTSPTILVTGPATKLVAISGGGQSANTGANFANPLVAQVQDAGGNAVPTSGTPVTFTATGACATIAGSPAPTDGTGTATSGTVTAGSTVTANCVITASSSGLSSATFTEAVTSSGGGTATNVAFFSPASALSIPVNTTSPTHLVVKVTNASNGPVNNASVTFNYASGNTATPTAASTPACQSGSGFTDSTGTLDCGPIAAGTTPGTAQFTAAVSGVPTATSQTVTVTGAVSTVTSVVLSCPASPNNSASVDPLGTFGPAGGIAVQVNGVSTATTVNLIVTPGGTGATASQGSYPATTNNTGSGAFTNVQPGGTFKAGNFTVQASAGGVFSNICMLTNTAGVPAKVNFLAPTTAISLLEGSSTATPAGGNDLKVQVLDVYGNPVPNQTVTFTQVNKSTAGVNIASALLCPPTTTNAAGILDCGTLTAGMTAGSLNFQAQAGNAFNQSNQITITSGPPAKLVYISGNNASTPAGTTFTNPLIAQVQDSGGNPINGVTVFISAVGSDAGASLSPVALGQSQVSGAGVAGLAGEVDFYVTANTVADPSGSYAVTLKAVGVPASPGPNTLTYTLNNTANTLTRLTVVSGVNVNTPEKSKAATPITVKLADQFGNLTSSTPNVTFTYPTGPGATVGGFPFETIAGSLATGLATSSKYLASCGLGGYTVTAADPSVAAGQPGSVGNPLYISENTIVGAPASINTIIGSGQSTQIGTAFATQLQVQVTDSCGTPVPGIKVTFTGPATGAGISANPTATTDINGYASVSVTANNTAGGPYKVQATVPGQAVVTPAIFTLTNTNGSASACVLTQATATTAVSTAFVGAAFQATVTDGQGNLLSGVPVSFVAIPNNGGPSLNFNPASGVFNTNPGGVATGSATANTIAGTYTVSASAGVSGNITCRTTGGSATEAVTNTAGPASKISFLQPNPAFTLQANTSGGDTKVLVQDQFNNPVPSAAISFAFATQVPATAGGPLPTPGSPGCAGAVTGADGTFDCGPLSAGNNLGTASFTATVTGTNVKATSNTVTITPGTAASCVFNAVGPVTVPVNSSLGTQLAVTVTDASNNLLAGIPVSFTAGSDPVTLASLAYTPVAGNFTTAPGGVGTAVATSNTKSGTYTVAATVPGANNTTITCQKAPTVTNLAGPISQIIIGTPAAPITAANGFTDSAVLGQFFTKPIPFFVADQYGNVVNQQVTVTFAAPPSNGGSTNPTASSTGGSLPVLTGPNGQGTFTPTSSAGFKAINVPGSYNITATYLPPSGPPITNGTVIQYTNLAVPVASCVFGTIATPNTTASTTAGAAFGPNAFKVSVTGSDGNPFNGASVVYAVSANNPAGATATFPASVTTAAGVANPSITASNTAGTFTVTATASDGTKTVQCGSIAVTTTAGAPATVAVTFSPAANPLNLAPSNSPSGTNLLVKVTDINNNPVAGAALTFAYGAGTAGASPTATSTGCGSATPPVTDATGSFNCGPITPGTATGTATFKVTAIVASGPNAGTATGTSPLINVAGTATQLVATSGTPQTAASGATFANLVAQLEDGVGNPISTSGVVVNFMASPAGCVTNLPAANSVTTNASGQATFAAPIAQTTTTNVACVITAASTGLTSATFTLNITGTAGGGSGYTLKILQIPGFPPGHGRVGSGFGRRTAFVVKLVDASGNGVSDFINFTILSGGTTSASFSGGVPTKTLGDGTATVYVSAGASAGTFSIQVTSPKLSGTVTDTTNSLTDTGGKNLIEPFQIS